MQFMLKWSKMAPKWAPGEVVKEELRPWRMPDGKKTCWYVATYSSGWETWTLGLADNWFVKCPVWCHQFLFVVFFTKEASWWISHWDRGPLFAATQLEDFDQDQVYSAWMWPSWLHADLRGRLQIFAQLKEKGRKKSNIFVIKKDAVFLGGEDSVQFCSISPWWLSLSWH